MRIWLAQNVRPCKLVAMSTTGRHIASLRKEFGITQAQLADGIGTDQTTISKLERGVHSLSWVQAVAIAEFLEVPLCRIRGKTWKEG